MVEVRDPERKQVHVYTGLGFREKGGDFITKMILGPEAYIDLYSKNPEHEYYGYRIERVSRGYSQEEMEALYGIEPQTDNAVAKLEELGFKNVRRTMIPGAKHSSLSRALEWERLRLRDEHRPDEDALLIS